MLAIAAWSYCSGVDGGMLEGGRAALVSDLNLGGAWRHLAETPFPDVSMGCRIVYFPYFAPALMAGAFALPMGGVPDKAVRDAEEECLLELEHLLKSGLINSLLLELVQVSTGFILSTGFLADLRILFVKYDAKIVVDEVMTAGRTSDYLLYSQKLGFDADYITMGK